MPRLTDQQLSLCKQGNPSRSEARKGSASVCRPPLLLFGYIRSSPLSLFFFREDPFLTQLAFKGG